MSEHLRVALEVVPRRTFAIAIDWPGWSRSGRDEEAALDALLAAGPRYAAALEPSGIRFEPPQERRALEIVERVPGDATTAFGAPAMPLAGDDTSLAEDELARHTTILEAGWAAFDAAAARHVDDPLATGPRGGGRSIDRMIEHVRGADESYLVKLGARPPKSAAGPAGRDELRATAVSALHARARGLPIANASRTASLWSPRFYVRRATWHALDHAWEIEDRALAAR